MPQVDHDRRGIFWREFLCLWGAGIGLAVLSFSISSLPWGLVRRELWFPFPFQSYGLIATVLVVQSGVKLAIFVGGGLVVARKLGLGAPVLDAWFRLEPVRPRLRAALIPIVITVLVILGSSALARASWLRPKRAPDPAIASEQLSSPEAAQAFDEIEKLGLVGTKPLTWISAAVLHLYGSIEGELDARLFETSVLIFLLVQISGARQTIKKWQMVWVAVLVVALFRAVENVAVLHQNSMFVLNIFRKYGVIYDTAPIWLTAVRTGLRVVPSATALGLLYVYYGIEASIVANFCAALASPLLNMFWLAHFR
jgi:hypothetical protein